NNRSLAIMYTNSCKRCIFCCTTLLRQIAQSHTLLSAPLGRPSNLNARMLPVTHPSLLLALQAPAPAVVPADTAWMLISTALVLLMTPALAFFYGGLVRFKNSLNT